MKGDFSRSTFDPTRHYSGVRMQQGRVQLDADWNEQADLARHRVEVEALDTLGHCGGPLNDAAFGVVAFGGPADGQVEPSVAAAPTAGDVILTPGRYYVDGILCQSERHVRYGWQPDLPAPWANPPVGLTLAQAGFHLLYLDVWDRHLTALEHPRIRETALGGPDTATRTRTVWQVRSLFLRERLNGADTGPLCGSGALPAAPTGTLRARAEPDPADQGPCVVPPGAGYRGLENQLYRVEVHGGGTALDLAVAGPSAGVVSADPQTRTVVLDAGGAAEYVQGDTVELYLTAAGKDVTAGTVAQVVSWNSGTKTLVLTGTFPAVQAGDLPRLRKIDTSTLSVATWKWSRDNGIVVSRILSIDAATREIVVESLGVDDVLDIDAGHWVEVTDDYSELNGLPGQLLQVERVDPTSRTVVTLTPPTLLATVAGGVDPTRTPKLRRWDGVGAIKANAAAGAYATLEDGVQVRFGAGTYHTGDFWLIPARTATADAQSGTVEWPVDSAGTPVARARMGIVHHYCRLAVVERTGTGAVVPATDCRCLFVPLTSVPAIHYVSGAGQEARPIRPWTTATRVPLGLPLVVGVANGTCHEGVQVRFSRVANEGVGTLSAANSLVDSGADFFVADVGADGLARCKWWVDCATQHQRVQARLLLNGVEVHPPILFNASLSVASEVSYRPEQCTAMGAEVDTVQEALDWLCAHRGNECEVTVGERGDFKTLKEALAGLKPGGSVCICLLRGEHLVEGELAVGADGAAVKISGCGTGTKIILRGPLVVGPLASFILRDLDVEASNVPRPIRISECLQVHFDNCSLRQVGELALVSVSHAHRVRIAGCTFTSVPQQLTTRPTATGGKAKAAAPIPIPFANAAFDVRATMQRVMIVGKKRQAPGLQETVSFFSSFATMLGSVGGNDADVTFEQQQVSRPRRGAAAALAASTELPGFSDVLALADGDAFVTLEDNIFFGYVLLYGAGDKPPVWQDVPEALRVGVRERKVRAIGSNLVVRGNALTMIYLDREAVHRPAEELAVFRNCMLSDNELMLPSQVLAGAVKLTSNQFPWTGVMLHALGETVTAVGNAGPNRQTIVWFTTPDGGFDQAGNIVDFQEV